MPRNGSGVQSSPGASYPAVASTLIESAKFNAVIDDINSVLTLSLAADGQTTVTGDQSMNTHKHTSLSNGTARGDSTALGQLQDAVINWVVATGTVDAITATYSPAITALVDGQVCCVRSIGANTSATPTFAPNGLTARTIVKNGGAALVAGNIGAAGFEFMLRYNLANTRWELLNSANNNNLTGGVTSVGNAATVVTNANLTGHVTSVGNAAVLGSFSLAQLNTALNDGDVVPLNGDAGTPSALVGTNITGTAAGLSIGGNAVGVTVTAVVTGEISSSSPTAGVGYAAGAGVSPAAINRGGSVTANAVSGLISINSAAYLANIDYFAATINNTSYGANDIFLVNGQHGTSSNELAYNISRSSSANQAILSIRCSSGITTAVTVSFVILKGSAS